MVLQSVFFEGFLRKVATGDRNWKRQLGTLTKPSYILVQEGDRNSKCIIFRLRSSSFGLKRYQKVPQVQSVSFLNSKMLWTRSYRTWWGFTVLCALFTIFTETYAIGFSPAGLRPHSYYTDASAIIEYVLVTIFSFDILMNFNLVFIDEEDEIVTDRKKIAWNYFRGMFWYDFAGVFPFYQAALAISGELENDSQKAQYLAILRLVKLVRLHRAKQLFDILQYNTHVSLFQLTLVRNFCFCFIWSHFSACVFYFIARQHDFDPDNTWIGGSVEGLNGFERYLTSLYWSVVTVSPTEGVDFL
jgi:hypothetical protein